MLQGGVDSRVEEWRDPEPAGEDQPNPTLAPAGFERAGAPPGMTPADVEGRSEVGRYIPLSALPGDRDDLLARLPEERRFETVAQIWAALGGYNEERRT